MKFIDTPTLRVGYEERNESGNRTAICIHGWPDSPRTWNGVAGRLADAGWRVLVPAVRGFAPTTFRDPGKIRSGQLAALGCDLLDFIDALQLDRPALIGHDWGARAAANACGTRPGVASHLAMLSVGYGTNQPDQALSMEMLRNYWYHWLMATPRGEHATLVTRPLANPVVIADPLDCGKLILRIPGVGIALHLKVPPGGMPVNGLGSDEGLREDNRADVWSTCVGRKCLCLCFHARKWLGCERLDILHGFVSERS